MGYTVTQRIKSVTQPRGGYLQPRWFRQYTYSDGIQELNPCENVSPILIGLAVDYLTRYILTGNLQKSFNVSILGATLNDMSDKAEDLLRTIELGTHIDDNELLSDGAIVSSVKMCGFDVCYRYSVLSYVPIEMINADADTISNVRLMVKRAVRFFKVAGPLVKDSFTFDGGGYTNMVTNGDGDYLMSDSMFDMKVSTRPITKDHTLQILMYYIMGIHSEHPEFSSVKSIGIYNPRLDTSYIINVSDIPISTIQKVEEEVICYT